MKFVDIEGYNGMYEINKKGEVWSNYRGIIMKPGITTAGYYIVTLCKNGKRKNGYIHRLVAETFLLNDSPDLKTEVNHINSIKTDNRLENLEWVTSQENTRHAYKNAIATKNAWYNMIRENGKRNGHKNGIKCRKLSFNEAEEIRRLYSTKQYSQYQLAKMFNTSYATISRINNYKSYQEEN